MEETFARILLLIMLVGGIIALVLGFVMLMYWVGVGISDCLYFIEKKWRKKTDKY